MSSMPMIAPGPISAGASGSVNSADPQQAGAQDAFEQLFIQLMQQIQAALEQGPVEPGVEGAALPQDGEALPPELLAELEAFAAQLSEPVDPAQLQQALEQLQTDAVPVDQSRQLLQAAMLLQDARRQSGEEVEPLPELLQQMRQLDPVDPDRQGADRNGQADVARSIDELLQLAHRLRNQGDSGADAKRETAAGDPVEKPAQIVSEQPAEKVETSEPVLAESSSAGDKAGATLGEAVSAIASDKSTAPTAADEAPVAVAAGSSQVVKEAVPVAAAASETATRAVSQGAGVEPVRGGPVESTRAAEAANQAATVRAEQGSPDGRSGRGDSSGEGQREGARDQGLARWSDLRDSVVAQGQKLVQAENAFKNMMASQSTVVRQGDSVSLAQASSNASLTQLQQAYQGNSQSGIVLGLGERFGGERWNAAASQRIVWMAGQNVGHAELRLDPPELGSLNVRLNLQGEQASLSFTSPHAHVRDALEQQMPRLREMLAESGIELTDSNVSDQPQAGASGEQEYRGDGDAPDAADLELASIADEQLSGARMSLSLVDYYA
ncbi:hypothetical protein DV711_07370 [Motiliproteus coralliicola]|uniref:Flagellar hook-length control protein-like C-terminal domain-containing protein n=1 Tax=Motiliproteus coralliicola TaxID=2283196 RepID=A0A369WLB2_9GAMM|nr:flagellar hook-length control protein FliK [Motiliproteus coralliicola]RDE22417.1 hypothetical protein DV711_07370 [Motiliproteus coralliicola]